MVRYGIIGTNWITEKYIDAAKLSGKYELTAVCSRTMDRASEFAIKCGGNIQCFDSPEAMVKSGEIDAVYIATPVSVHFENAKIFLSHGIHCIIEKSICANLKEFDEIVKTANENNAMVFEAMRSTRNPNAKVIKDALADIGEIKYASFFWPQYSSRYDAFNKGDISPVFTNEHCGGSTYDLNVYCLSMAHYLFGKPTESKSMRVALSNGASGIDQILLKYDNMICSVCANKITHGTHFNEINGENGYININHIGDINTVTITDNDGNSKVLADREFENDMKYEASLFADIIENKEYEKARKELQRTRDVLEIMEKARKDNKIVFPADK